MNRIDVLAAAGLLAGEGDRDEWREHVGEDDLLPGLSQDLLDQLAGAWSRLDQARPAAPEDVPRLVHALAEWLDWAIRVDEELSATLTTSYPALCASASGGDALPGLRHVHRLVQSDRRPFSEMVTTSTGSPPTFHEAIWRRFDDLPPSSEDAPAGEESAYRMYLEGRSARTPAAAVTRFLLHLAVDLHDDVPEPTSGAG